MEELMTMIEGGERERRPWGLLG